MLLLAQMWAFDPNQAPQAHEDEQDGETEEMEVGGVDEKNIARDVINTNEAAKNKKNAPQKFRIYQYFSVGPGSQ